jgi:hypothetical protein
MHNPTEAAKEYTRERERERRPPFRSANKVGWRLDDSRSRDNSRSRDDSRPRDNSRVRDDDRYREERRLRDDTRARDDAIQALERRISQVEVAHLRAHLRAPPKKLHETN